MFLTSPDSEVSLPGSYYLIQENQLPVFMVEAPYPTFHTEMVVLTSHPKFIPKVVSDFCINQLINLLVIFPEPHSTLGENKLYAYLMFPGRALLY